MTTGETLPPIDERTPLAAMRDRAEAAERECAIWRARAEGLREGVNGDVRATLDRALAIETRLTTERDAALSLLAGDGPWPLVRVLARLLVAADDLLVDDDGASLDGLDAARDAGRALHVEILAALRGAGLSVPGDTEPPCVPVVHLAAPGAGLDDAGSVCGIAWRYAGDVTFDRARFDAAPGRCVECSEQAADPAGMAVMTGEEEAGHG